MANIKDPSIKDIYGDPIPGQVGGGGGQPISGQVVWGVGGGGGGPLQVHKYEEVIRDLEAFIATAPTNTLRGRQFREIPVSVLKYWKILLEQSPR